MRVLISKYLVVGVLNQYIHNTCSTDTPKLDMMDIYKNSKSLHYKKKNPYTPKKNLQIPTLYSIFNSENSVSFIQIFP